MRMVPDADVAATELSDLLRTARDSRLAGTHGPIMQTTSRFAIDAEIPFSTSTLPKLLCTSLARSFPVRFLLEVTQPAG